MFEFQNPAAFLLLLLIPLLFLLRFLKIFKPITFSAVLADWNGSSFNWNGKTRRFFSQASRFIYLIGYILVVIALADPVIQRQEKIFTSIGTDMIFVIDTSPSMAAQDMVFDSDGEGNRLEAAKQTISQIIKENEGVRFGIVALGSEAAVFVPPTSDTSTVLSRLSEINVGIMGNGSAIGDGLSTAICHLVGSSSKKKCIVLFTDGESNAGAIHPETAARLASENSITIYVVGIGSKGTVPIKYVDPVTGKLYSGYLDSSYNSAALRKISDAGGGRYFEVTTVADLIQSLKVVAKAESVSQSFTYRTYSQPYYKNFLLAALICFALAFFIKRILLREVV